MDFRPPRALLATLPVLALLLVQASPAAACADGCSGQCTLTVADWRATSETTFPGFDPRAVEDAGLFVGMTTRNLLAARGMRTAAVEIFSSLSHDPPSATAEARVAPLFVDAFRRHLDYVAGESVSVSLAIDPPDPLHLKTAAQARSETGADLLVTCRYAGASFRVREFRPDRTELRMRRVERTGQAAFRVMAVALSGALEGAEPAFIEEIRGGFIVDTLFETGTDGVELERSTFRVFEHFPGIDPPEGPPERATDPPRP